MFASVHPRFTEVPEGILAVVPELPIKNDIYGAVEGATMTVTISAGTAPPVESTQPESVYVRVTAVEVLEFDGIESALVPPAEGFEPVQSPAELLAVQAAPERFVVVHTRFAFPPEAGSVIVLRASVRFTPSFTVNVRSGPGLT